MQPHPPYIVTHLTYNTPRTPSSLALFEACTLWTRDLLKYCPQMSELPPDKVPARKQIKSPVITPVSIFEAIGQPNSAFHVRILITGDSSLLEQSNEAGETLLLDASKMNDIEAVWWLLALGADETATDNVGFGLLRHVMDASSLELFEFLVAMSKIDVFRNSEEFGCDDEEGLIPFKSSACYACELGNADLLESLFEFGTVGPDVVSSPGHPRLISSTAYRYWGDNSDCGAMFSHVFDHADKTLTFWRFLSNTSKW